MFTGSMVAVATPMNDDGSIDYKSYQNLIEFHIENNTDAIVPVGTTGESATIDHNEHCEIVSFVVDKVAKRIPVIAGTGANSTSKRSLLQNMLMKQELMAACQLLRTIINQHKKVFIFILKK